MGNVNSALTAGKTHCHSVHSSNMFRKHMKPFERFIDPLQMFPGALHIVIVLLIFRFTDIEDFDSIVSVSERLNELATHVADERLQAQLLSLASLPDLQVTQTRKHEDQGSDKRKEATDNLETSPSKLQLSSTSITSHIGSSARTPQPFSSLLPGALAAVLPTALPSPLTSDPGLRSHPAGQLPATLEELRTELWDLREDMELMKSQHNKEIKLLMNELDEEKKIRLSLQVEVQRMKKKMSK
ncbi:SH3 domain-containing kinase-binding protein 1 isoform X2 [Hypomesus transpacificus]|uniref:SH3 domain-containing kinase-binding protein 1 isoform X2 n=1 Tax=Hypomesus transpacificus TaxID=137520 RepID=UPI001F07814A|nr:SH3 domain-containing kinase-binding protein 1 isoform X2 [Hypomesus transpacificus]